MKNIVGINIPGYFSPKTDWKSEINYNKKGISDTF